MASAPMQSAPSPTIGRFELQQSSIVATSTSVSGEGRLRVERDVHGTHHVAVHLRVRNAARGVQPHLLEEVLYEVAPVVLALDVGEKRAQVPREVARVEALLPNKRVELASCDAARTAALQERSRVQRRQPCGVQQRRPTARYRYDIHDKYSF
jgi:hypothetical protein